MTHIDSAFELNHVTHQFDRGVGLEDFSVKIALGERVGLIGSSGAGKSTLIRLLNLTLVPTSGELRVGDRVTNALNPKSRRQLQRQIGTVCINNFI
jgi:phosphonate transport system ATP-binding protein